MNKVKLLKEYREGATFSTRLEICLFNRGYAISLTNNSFSALAITERKINIQLAKIKKIAKQLNLKEYYIGWWLDKKTNLGYLDLSLVINNKKEAVKIAKQYDQLAIFSFSKLDSIYL